MITSLRSRDAGSAQRAPHPAPALACSDRSHPRVVRSPLASGQMSFQQTRAIRVLQRLDASQAPSSHHVLTRREIRPLTLPRRTGCPSATGTIVGHRNTGDLPRGRHHRLRARRLTPAARPGRSWPSRRVPPVQPEQLASYAPSGRSNKPTCLTPPAAGESTHTP